MFLDSSKLTDLVIHVKLEKQDVRCSQCYQQVSITMKNDKIKWHQLFLVSNTLSKDVDHMLCGDSSSWQAFADLSTGTRTFAEVSDGYAYVNLVPSMSFYFIIIFTKHMFAEKTKKLDYWLSV